jgi:serine/threonine protein kinase/Tol biopolymer transport system component
MAALSAGGRLGVYEIGSLLGAGGMGEVYRAKDTKLGRDVALKILPASFTNDPERVARFRREAQVLAALNHPHIGAIYGLEEANSTQFLVLELVDGESLDKHIARGPIPVVEALALAKQIAEALDAAHEKGIIHRDLKPANIALTKDGVVKVLDFGLAKAVEATSGSFDLTVSPTITSPAMMTGAGVILGTAAYMSPEQAKGRATDKRADIWAFGVVLYELLTGERLFIGEDTADTLAQVLTTEPDLNRVPSHVRLLLQRCLEKDPKRRLRDIGDAIALVDTGQIILGAAKPRPAWVSWAIAGLAVASLVPLGLIHFSESPPALEAVRFSLDPPSERSFVSPFGALAVSPNGRYVVYGAAGKGGSSLWLRPLDSLAARPLTGTENGTFPTWSPDSESLAFYVDGRLKRIDINGGTPITLSDAAGNDPVTATGAWNGEGVIIFGSSAGLRRVSASGGGTSLLTKTDPARKETGHGYPQFLPDGNRFLYFVASDDSNIQGVYASSLRSPGQRWLVLRTDAKAVYVPPRASYPGYLLWMQDQTLLAQRFDVNSLQVQGDPVSVAEAIGRLPPVPIRAAFWASDAGTLIYFTNPITTRPLVWMSRQGKPISEAAPADNFTGPIALAPDAKRVAVTRTGPSSLPNFDVWWRDLDRGVMTRLTSDPARDQSPVWSPDGKWIAFASNRNGGVFQIYRKDASGAGQEEPLTKGSYDKFPYDWSRDGRVILYGEQTGRGGVGSRLMALPVQGDRNPVPVVDEVSPRSSAAISPDSQWVAYGSEFSGSLEVYIRAYPAPGSPQGLTHISIAGGFNPKWRGDGKELYYRTRTGLMVAAIQASAQGIRAETPRELFNAQIFGYDVTADGQRFLLAPGSLAQDIQTLTVVSHWQAGLRR